MTDDEAWSLFEVHYKASGGHLHKALAPFIRAIEERARREEREAMGLTVTASGGSAGLLSCGCNWSIDGRGNRLDLYCDTHKVGAIRARTTDSAGEGRG